MLKISLVRPTVKYVITPCTPKSLKKKFTFFNLVYETKMPVLSIKERKAKFNTDNLIFRKESNLPSGYVDNEYHSAESLTNKYKLFRTKSKRTINSLAPSKKYIMIEEFKDELRGLKNIWDKKTGTIKRTKNKWNKKWNKKKLKMLDDEINDILEKLDENLTIFF